MNISQQLTILSLTVLLTACAGGHHRPPRGVMPPAGDQLSTKITPGGLKIFHYTVSNQAPNGGPGGRRGTPPSGGGGSGRGAPGQLPGPGAGSDKAGIEHMLLAKLSQTGYCRNGYIEISSSVSSDYSFIRGECREVASQDDLNRFESSVVKTN